MYQLKKNNINLYITFDGLSDPLGESQIFPYLDAFKTNNELYLVSLEKKNKILNFNRL